MQGAAHPAPLAGTHHTSRLCSCGPAIHLCVHVEIGAVAPRVPKRVTGGVICCGCCVGAASRGAARQQRSRRPRRRSCTRAWHTVTWWSDAVSGVPRRGGAASDMHAGAAPASNAMRRDHLALFCPPCWLLPGWTLLAQARFSLRLFVVGAGLGSVLWTGWLLTCKLYRGRWRQGGRCRQARCRTIHWRRSWYYGRHAGVGGGRVGCVGRHILVHQAEGVRVVVEGDLVAHVDVVRDRGPGAVFAWRGQGSGRAPVDPAAPQAHCAAPGPPQPASAPCHMRSAGAC